MDISRSESQQPIPGVDEQVLPAIVLGQALPVIATVVLEDEARRGVVKVSSTDKPTGAVVQIGLHLGMRQACPDQQPAQPRLHWRFSWSREDGERSQLASAGTPMH